ncbi:unnamed protein product [Meloidogyne enterolobii]|uniref:Uncharacterized protein n=1 Tax=Meloidogyne enterolobii TaxID=390850 RepID=A0ACB0XL45_MELEN
MFAKCGKNCFSVTCSPNAPISFPKATGQRLYESRNTTSLHLLLRGIFNS